jgi:CelD/BcsL family acetyltransferase involved in cellulose biosynthesis
LLRHLVLAAIEENAHTFDFGFGDEAYKYRYATDVVRLQTWGLYPSVSTAIK